MTQAHRGEDAFDGIGRPQVFPVFGREVVEGQEFFAVLGQTFTGLGILRAAGREEQVEGLFGLDAGGCHPDVVNLLLGSWLLTLGHFIQNVHGLMNPAALLAVAG